MLLTDTEWKVMNAVWRRKGPVSAREILTEVGPDTGWAYTTLKTMMDRLVEKRVLAVDRSTQKGAYRALMSRRRALQAAARGLAEKAFEGGMAPLVHFLIRSENLSPAERAELRAMLAESDAGEPDR